jgi:ADP-ribose pyrophosphatase
MAKWKTLRETVLMSHRPWFEVIRQEVETDRGVIVPDFYQVRFGAFVVCVPFTVSGEVLTLRTYKHGLGRVSTTFPAGYIDPGEDPAAAMARELMEETGHRAGRLVELGRFIDNGNQVGSTGTYFAAFDCVPERAPDAGDLETMEVVPLTPAELESRLAGGDMPILHHAAAWMMAARRIGEVSPPGP